MIQIHITRHEYQPGDSPGILVRCSLAEENRNLLHASWNDIDSKCLIYLSIIEDYGAVIDNSLVTIEKEHCYQGLNERHQLSIKIAITISAIPVIQISRNKYNTTTSQTLK